jgi:transglutaminase-like putative cysteine protease
MCAYLEATEIIDWRHHDVRHQAMLLAAGTSDPVAVAKRCFEWVRDHIKHSSDYQLNPVTCTASDVLRAGTGFCYAKSHLLAALLRANAIPTGFCYQRLSVNGDGAPYCLHGLNAVFLPEIGWYRLDPRGNRPGIDAAFTPPQERLAFTPGLPGEADLPEIWPSPLPIVVHALRTHATYDAILKHLPDLPLVAVQSGADNGR